jgi:hypothetical protein
MAFIWEIINTAGSGDQTFNCRRESVLQKLLISKFDEASEKKFMMDFPGPC